MSSLNMKLADVGRWPDIGMALASLLLARKARTFSIHCLHPFSAFVPSWLNVGPSVVDGGPALGQVGSVFHI